MLLRNMNVKELILQEAFYQNFPLEVSKFVDYCKKKRGLNVDRKYLEYIEKEGLFRPIMRVYGSRVSNTTDLKELYENDHVIDPRQKGFSSWNKFYELSEGYQVEIVHSYYHTYQIYFLKEGIRSRITTIPL